MEKSQTKVLECYVCEHVCIRRIQCTKISLCVDIVITAVPMHFWGKAYCKTSCMYLRITKQVMKALTCEILPTLLQLNFR